MKLNLSFQLSFNQLKFISLFSLIVIHCISFVNDFYKIPLDKGIPLFTVFGSYHLLFILISGIAFANDQFDSILNGRLSKKPDNSWAYYFLVLMLAEFIKGLLLWQTLVYFLVWDFLKTIFFSFLIIQLVSRVHILANLFIAIILAGFYDSIKAFLKSFETLNVPSQLILSQWSFFHFHLIATYLAFFTFILFVFWKSRIHIKLKRLLSVFLLTIFALIVTSTLKTTPSEFEYLFSQNWWVWSLVGNSKQQILFPLLPWFPTIAIGFVGTYYTLHFKDRLTTKFLNILFFISLILLIYTGYLLLNRKQIDGELMLLWNIEAMSRSTILGEVFKATFFIVNYLFLLFLNSLVKSQKTQAFFHKFSLATFWIYIGSTTWPIILSRILHQQGFTFSQTLVVVFITTLFISFYIAKTVYLLSKKSLKMRLIKH